MMNKIENYENKNIGKVSNEVEEILDMNELLFSISKIIIEYREENNITQTELAKEIRVNQTMISKIESGKYNPTFKQVYKISRKLTENNDMFKDILREILRNFEEMEYIKQTYIIETDIGEENVYKEYYKNSINNRKIIYINKKYYNRGESINERYESKYTING